MTRGPSRRTEGAATSPAETSVDLPEFRRAVLDLELLDPQ
jgi:hypothetical protein